MSASRRLQLAVVGPFRRVGAILALSVFLAALPWLAQGQDSGEAFAGLTVTAYGDQEVDILTGITTLPEGGEVVDREREVTLSAEWLRYREGIFLEGEQVEMTGEFGTAYADAVRIDFQAGLLEAWGEVRFERAGLGLQAESLEYHTAAGVVRFEGPIYGTGTELEAAAALFDAENLVLLLVAPYRYQDELFELSSNREGALLSLSPAEDESVVASSKIDAELLARLDPYLP